MQKWFGTNKYDLLLPEQSEKPIPSNNVTPSLPEPTRDGLRPEIQGLRAVAIWAVLLFHMWDKTFPVGYLGVDCFFVISGYLMIMLLSRKQELTFSDSVTFYYRRIKRIVPTYLFVIILTLIACYWLISEFEFGQIISESIPSMFFYSNLPFVHKTNYFDIKSKYQFFLHTWSLSTELQFYLFVPLLILIIGSLTNVHFLLTLLFLFILCFLSFCRQIFSSSNAKHMTLDGRVWQFLFGFLAHFVYKAKLLDWTVSKEQQGVSYKLITWIRNLTPISLLVILLTFPLIDVMEQQIQRLLVVFLTALIIAIRQDDSILSLDTLVNLGDVSYSIYLIHWPILTMHRYLDPDTYEDGKGAGHIVGSYLIGVSILSGYLIEKAFKRVLLFVKNWYSLLKLLFILYLAAGVSLMFLNRDAMNLIEDKPLTKAGEEKRLQDTIMLWKTRKDGAPFSINKTMALNSEIAYFDETCHNKSHVLPSSFKDMSAFEKICHETGQGTKNIVVFGNSHAYKAFIGIVQIFKPIAKHITLISTPACVPGSKDHQHHTLYQSRKKKCENFINNTPKVLQQYDFPIDIVITLFGWHTFKDYSADETAKLQAETQDLFGNLSSVAREIAFVPLINVVFKKHPLREVQNQLKSGKPVGKIGDTITRMANSQKTIRQVMENVECPRCVKVSWENLWCDKTGFCSAIEPRRHLTYFLDEHHCSTLGAFHIGDYLLHLYKDYMKEHA